MFGTGRLLVDSSFAVGRKRIGDHIGQVSLPFGAGLVAAATGVAGILAMIARSLAASAAAGQWSRPPQ